MLPNFAVERMAAGGIVLPIRPPHVRRHRSPFRWAVSNEEHCPILKMKVVLPTVLFFICAGCASSPSPKMEAEARVKPVAKALAAYHRDVGYYPSELNDLRGQYIRAGVPFESSDTNHIWRMWYYRDDKDKYSLQFYIAPCSVAYYTNGQIGAYYGPAFK